MSSKVNEYRILKQWEKDAVFERLVEKNRGKPPWSFVDGPITANNPMGVHHAWGRTYKDLYQRFKAMTGHELRYQNGFDCQGLWVEVEVEKELGFGSKRDIEAYGIDRFVEKCKARVRRYAELQTQQSIRLGYWMDWKNSYYTMSDENNYTIWQFLRRCHDRGYLYHGFDSMPWCPRCGTGISQHEISNEERPEVTHTSPTVKLPLLDRSGEFLLVWTTTPWTLTANVACAVEPNLRYSKVRQGGETFYVVEPRREAVLSPRGAYEVLAELPGEALVGLEYQGPFDELPAQKGLRHRVIPWREVSAGEGTGIVHIAPGCGREDYQLGREQGLDPIGPIDEAGVFLAGFGDFTGTEAAAAGPAILRSLRDKNRLYDVESYRHSYPVCWRCKTELLFRLVDEWYIAMEELRYQIIEVTKQTRWIPEVGQQLEIEWLMNMHDWMISKKRYWGLALPIYLCDSCGAFDVIGSREELEGRAVAGWKEFDGHSPHRPWIDAVKVTCSKCSTVASRIPDVGNPWLDAGIVPYSTIRYNSDRDYWNTWFPADWISESFPGQFRNWFYAILAMSTVMENRPPFKVMFGYRLMKDEHGEEMHKSKGNAVDFNEAAEREGADAMRWLFASHNPDYDLRFGWNKIYEARREFLTLWNVYQFFLTYAEIDRFVPGRAGEVGWEDLSELDRWMLQRLEMLVQKAQENYEDYSVHLFMREVKGFVHALSRWYLRRSRRRFWKGEDDADKQAAYQTLHECLVTAAQLLAPIIPFATEEMYQRLVRDHSSAAEVSVHLTEFPKPGRRQIDEDLLDAMDTLQEIAEQGHAARQQANLKVRQPVATLRVAGLKTRTADCMADLLPLLEDELNVKRVELIERRDSLYRIEPHLDLKIAGPQFKGGLRSVEEAIATAKVEVVVEAVRRGEILDLEIEDRRVQVTPEAIILEQRPHDGWSMAEGNGFVVALDTRLSEELLAEGKAREVVRQIQNLRKDLGFEIGARIRIRFQSSDSVARLFKEYGDYLSAETLAVEIHRLEIAPPGATEVVVGDDRLAFELDLANRGVE